jgi:hypothetical protein
MKQSIMSRTINSKRIKVSVKRNQHTVGFFLGEDISVAAIPCSCRDLAVYVVMTRPSPLKEGD